MLSATVKTSKDSKVHEIDNESMLGCGSPNKRPVHTFNYKFPKNMTIVKVCRQLNMQYQTTVYTYNVTYIMHNYVSGYNNAS